MKNTNKLSVVISAYNEEAKIEDCLSCLKDLADEIIFIDNSSTDNTVKIAKKYTSKIYKRDNNPMLNVNKNFGFTKATGEWILSLDADERITDELKKEIQGKILNEDNPIVGYWIPRKNIIFNKWIEHSGWYPDYQLRLFKKDKGKFAEKHVHEMVALEGQSEYLQNPMVHYNYESIRQFIQKHCMIYAPNEAENIIKNGYVFHAGDIVTFPAKEFLSRFFAREGYKDGFHGLVLATLMAFYHLIIFMYIWEHEKFKDQTADTISLLEHETKKLRKDFIYWISHVEIIRATGILKKISLKVKRKIIH